MPAPSTPAPPGLYIGIDGGGTGTSSIALLVEEQRNGSGNSAAAPVSVAEVDTGPSNYNSVGKPTAQKNICDAIIKLLAEANKRTGVKQMQHATSSPNGKPSHNGTHSPTSPLRHIYTLADIRSIVLVVSGCNNSNDAIMMENWVRPLFESTNIPSPYIVAYNDSVGALVAGTSGRLHGIACISGTGMMCMGKKQLTDSIVSNGAINGSDHKVDTTANTAQHICGGNGALMDDGSGFTVGLKVARACFAASDGMGQPTAMSEAVMTQLKLSNIDELVGWLYTDLSWGKVATLSPIAFDFATTDSAAATEKVDLNAKLRSNYIAAEQSPPNYTANDAIAWQIVREAADYLVNAIVTCITKLQFAADEPLTAVLSGGMLNKRMFYETVSYEVSQRVKQTVVCTRPLVEPEYGAALLGIEMLRQIDDG